MSKDFLAKKKEINTLKTDVNALKAVDERIWTNLDTINKAASTAKIKAEEGVAKADDALEATRTNANKIKALETNVKALDATDERIWTNLDTINRTASTAKIKAEEGVAKADSALARNVFTDEEKAKLASITNPIIIKGRVDTVNDLPTEAVIGWFYFVGLESASSYEEYCYSENGWEYIGLSQEGVDLSNYYTKAQVDTTVNELKAIDNSLGTRIDNVDSKASKATTKAEEGVAKANNALAQASSNTTSINSLNTDVNALKAVDERIWTNLDTINKTASTAKIKAEEGVAKADDALEATRTNADNISTHETRLDSIDNTLSSHDTRITTAQQKANSVDEKVDSTNEVVGQLSTSLQSAYNKINAHTNDIAINRTTLGTQCKNLLKNNAVTQTVSGVTFTVNNDKSVTLNGTSTAQADFYLRGAWGSTSEILQKNKYIASIGISQSSTFNGVVMHCINNTTSIGSPSCNHPSLAVNSAITAVYISVSKGYTFSNYKLYPMIRYADITDDTYEPYKENVDERLIQNKSDIAVNHTTLGYTTKNLLKIATTIKSGHGVTITVNDDKSITVNGTATSEGVYAAIGEADVIAGNKYILNGGTGTGGTYGLYTENFGTVHNFGSDNVYIPNTTGKAVFRIFVRPGVTISNVTFKPMLRYADITDNTYEPYKESVDERITNNVSDIAINKSTLGYQRKNLFNETKYLSSIASVSIGTFNISGNSITLTATGKDCYTKPHTSSDGGYRIPVEPDTDYILSWQSDNTYAGLVYVFMNGNLSQQKHANNKDTKYLKFTTNSNTTFITIRLGVATSGNSITYSNIMLRYADILDDTYEPYQPSVREQIIGTYFPTTQEKGLANNTDLNTITEIGNYVCYMGSSAATMINCPTKAGGFRLIVTNLIVSSNDNSTIRYQWIIPNNLNDVLCFRRRIDISTDTFSNWYSFKSYQPGLQEQIPYSISVPGKSTSAAISYSGVPTLICLAPNTADSTAGGLYMINSAGAVIKLMAETGIVIATNTANNTFTITNNTTTVMDVCISRCWGR